ncbi:branched-chain amino acid ABC transporter permease [Minwuia thermotolerans]|uniref:Branched-chain amino acid ABC transporter permease n=1 Tax=Minwuia thermotolerans TaxID=2056226 RepID=A0A2M9G3V3_9PROT|nr:branched-chain amino acid ABC transporter permease [Minwuia thermotolerans]PJK30380.1 branched-chain amino acid ABC transporter permease [Minwuia thermotolerans]
MSRYEWIVGFAVMAVLLALPSIADMADEPFWVTLVARTLVVGIGAIGLNLVLGYGGMVSFGHAAYVGIGAYVVGIGFHHYFEDGYEWMNNGWIQLVAALGISGLAALVIGAICLRTRGVYFIMITLAFAQMVYFVFVGLDIYGGDDGLSLYEMPTFGGGATLGDDRDLYYVAWVAMAGSLFLVHRLINARFGMVIRGAKSNDRRMKAIGFPTYRYRLTAFALSGMICGLSGFLTANLTEFVSPDMMHWTRSGDLIIMVVLGGMGTLFGPVYGALAFLLVEELLSAFFQLWRLWFGPLLILVVLFARGGIVGLLKGRVGRNG